MSEWLYGIAGGVAGAGAATLLARHLWHTLNTNQGKPQDKWKTISRYLFGDVSSLFTAHSRNQKEKDMLRKEVRQFSSLLNLAPFPVWRRNNTLDIQYYNLAYSSMLEEVPERIQEEHALELAEHARQLAERAVHTQHTSKANRHIVIDGQRRLYHVYEVPDVDLGGTIGFAFDATEEEDTQEALRRHIRAHSDLLEASTMATAIFDASMRLKFYNSAYVALWKLDKQWLAAEPTFSDVLELLREKRRLPEVVNFQHFKQQRIKLFNNLTEPHEELLHLPDGKIVRFIIIPHALGGLIFSYEDVTNKIALERSFNTLIAVQRETLNNLHEGIAVLGEDGRLRLSNPVFQRLWMLHPDFLNSEPHIGEILERTKSYYTQTDEWQDYKQRLMEQILARRMHFQRVQRTDGSVLDWSTIPLPDGATLITYYDITDSTLVERSLIERNEALREADKLKTEFLLSVSYELRSPLTSITGFSEILRDRYFGELNTKQAEYVNAINDSAQQLGQLINDILDLATIEAGYMRLDIQESDIRLLLKEVISLVKERAKSNQVTLRLECSEDIGIFQVDDARIKQVIFNLLNNSLRFTPAKGRIRIGARVEDGDNICLWVIDNGVGISAQEQKSVFDRFRPGAVRTQLSGAGLGLAMVKNFIELHGGRVELESELGKGTQVRCYIPRNNPTIVINREEAEIATTKLANPSELLEKRRAGRRKKDTPPKDITPIEAEPLHSAEE